MPLVQRTGIYLARPISLTIEEEPGKCPRAIVMFSVFSFRDGGTWIDVPNDEKITGRFTLFNKNGSPNEINLRALVDALGWDGTSFRTLTETDWSEKEVQIVVGEHEYNGQVSMEVKYLNPRDYAPAAKKSDPQTVLSLEQKYGATLKALFKNGSVKAGAASTAKPTTIPAINVNPADAAKASAWKAFLAKTPGFEPAKRNDSFKQVCAEANPGVDLKLLDADAWAKTERVIVERYSAELDASIPF